MAIRLGRPLPDASRDLPERRCGNPSAAQKPPAFPIRSCSRWGLPCHPRRRERGALLPHPFTLTGRPRGVSAVCFLWHFPWGRPRRALPGTVFPWSPDFPPLAGFPIARSSHPAIRRLLIIRPKQPPAKAVKNRKQQTYWQRPAANRACQDQRARALRTGGSGVEMRQVKGRSLLCRNQ